MTTIIWLIAASVVLGFSLWTAWRNKKFTRWNAMFCVLALVPGANVPVAFVAVYAMMMELIAYVKRMGSGKR